MAEERPDIADHNFLAGGGEMGNLVERFEWAASAIGPIAGWPQSLRSTVSLMLRSPIAMVLLWGEDGVMIYNDAYAGFAGRRHPELLGSKVREGWPEVAAFNDNVMKVGLAGGTLEYEDRELVLYRHGTAEQVWMNLYYSPVIDESGRPGGVICHLVETSGKVRAARWLSGERERLRQMFEQAPGFIAVLTGERHVFELANPAFQQLVGHREVVGLPIREALPELEGQGFFGLMDQVYASGVAYSGAGLAMRLQRRPGAAPQLRHVDLVYQPLRDGAGAIFGLFVQGLDATDRVAAERAARASEAQFETFAQAMPNHVWTALPDGRLDWFNVKVYEYSGAAPGSLDGKGWAGIVHPEDMAGAEERWAEAVASEEIYETQFRLRRADGTWRWHLSRALPIRGEDGQVRRWIGTNTDIEDERAAGEALSDLADTLEQQVEQRTAERDRMWRLSTDLMIVVRFDGTILAVNPAWTSLLGWTEQEALGHPLLDFVHPEDRAPTIGQMDRLAAGARTIGFQNRFRVKAGGTCILSWTAVPDGGLIHGVGRDVTAEHEAAAALKASEAALQQSQKMETIGKLTGGVAHDFNNLLQVISGNLELLAREIGEDQRAGRLVGNALAGVARGSKLASQLLAFGRRQPLAPKVMNIGRLITGMDDMLRRALGETVEVETVVSGGLWNTMIDPTQIETALLNLAINARDAMEGGGKLTIEAGNAFLDDYYVRHNDEVEPGQYVVLAVTDTGSGMPAEVAQQAFEPFFSTKPEGKGTGLGLSMVYGFVKQSGGHVKIYSELGQGTTVKLYLPRADQREDIVPGSDHGPVAGGTETILVAEDDEQVLETTVAVLTNLGYRVLKARDAASAFTVIESGIKVDLLFTDVVMPGPMKSTELARKAAERQPDIAVIFTSGYTDNAIVHGGRLDPGVELLSKPYTLDALARKVRQVLSSRPPRRPEPARRAAEASSKGADGLRILLVEDDLIIRMSTAELLRKLGHEVLEAGDGKQALAVIERGAPLDVLFTDIGLPGMPGTEVAALVRAARPEIGVIFATGYNERPAMAGQANVHLLSKPYGGAEITRVLEAARKKPG
ncbi:PAS domain S-box protein [Roseococcus sp. SYP-B2431]|uniref:PAS domain-containing protein n=1 Tax=Roseococcus sp. SYP-B2431 TaxID=2496640 RepID=UPI00103BD2E4|nr:PAS domain-containing protein [Roseococcus sp. SYP-B2431]TCH98199.1 PAS domain S-box protein [Roseococcus sp. SYP-B2431]